MTEENLIVLEDRVQQTQNYFTNNLLTTMTIIESLMTKVKSLQILDDKIDDIQNQLIQLENQTMFLQALVDEMKESINTRVFSEEEPPSSLDKENGDIAFILS